MGLGLGSSLSKTGLTTPSIVTDSLVMKHNYSAGAVVPISDGAASFDGSNSHIDCGDPIISGTSDYSFCAWISKGTAGTVKTIAGNYTGGAGLQGIQFTLSNSEKFQTYTDGTNDYVTGATDVPLNTWTHVAATRSSNNAIVYVNGVSDATGTLDNDITGLDFTIGANPVSFTEDFTGYICNVGVWSRALGIAEIKSIMNKNYSGLTSSETTGLVSWWNLDVETATNGTAGSGGVKDSHGSNHGDLE